MKTALQKTIQGNKYFYAQVIFIILLCIVSLNASACNDSMKFSRDKQFHAGGSAVLAASAMVVTDNPWAAFGASLAVGAIKEAYDYKHPAAHCASGYDFAYDVLGAAIGSFVGYKIKGLYVAPKRDGVLIAYFNEFK